LNLSWLIGFYKEYPDKKDFFIKELPKDSARIKYHFDEVAGTDRLRKQIIAGRTEQEIRKTWELKLSQYKILRKKYLLYPDYAKSI
jgi:uncharacterized protein YbbC (DUF1343 family)